MCREVISYISIPPQLIAALFYAPKIKFLKVYPKQTLEGTTDCVHLFRQKVSRSFRMGSVLSFSLFLVAWVGVWTAISALTLND